MARMGAVGVLGQAAESATQCFWAPGRLPEMTWCMDVRLAQKRGTPAQRARLEVRVHGGCFPSAGKSAPQSVTSAQARMF